jgi:tRNA (cmo5U34)-methyltransferase
VPWLYTRLIRRALPAYDRLQDELAGCTAGLTVATALDLGTGTGETARRVLAVHATARMVCVDRDARALKRARAALPSGRVVFREQDLADPLPPPHPVDLVTSALAIHHLDGAGKRRLFGSIAGALSLSGRFVMADVVIPEDPADKTTPLHRRYDHPSKLDDQLAWLREVGLEPAVAWTERDLAVIVANRTTLPPPP